MVQLHLITTGAVIGMTTPFINQIEASTTVSICAVLTGLTRLEISLTAFVRTQPITATG